MDQHIDRQPCSQTLLIVNNSQEKLTPSCSILASFNQIYISILEAPTILPWIQQHQPDLIILDLEWFQVIDLQLITTLRFRLANPQHADSGDRQPIDIPASIHS
ncbi:MAG: hypothetical protein RLZZ74_737 [Cyanobacteriota bacterium]